LEGNPIVTTPPTRYRNGLGTAGFVLGVCSLILPLVGWIPAIVGLGLAIGGWVKVRRGEADNRGLTLWGFWLSLVSLILWLVVFASVVHSSGGA
jgi:hypothetical protein